jgi:hypothetical protein
LGKELQLVAKGLGAEREPLVLTDTLTASSKG